MSLLIVGSVAFDAIETPYGKTDKIIGGAGTFISLSASYFGVNTKIVSVVGGDFPQEYLNLLKNKGIDISGIQIKKDQKTFFWSGKYHDDMNSRDTLITELNVLGTFDPLVPASYQDSDYLLLGNLSPQVQRQVIERLTKRPKLVAMDTMNFWMDIALDELKKTISMVDLLIINDSEAKQLSGETMLMNAAEKILTMGPKYLIIKKGEHGAMLFTKDQVFYTPALPLKSVFDPTGAGDTFAGGFMGYVAKTDNISFENMKTGVVYGSAMASFCVEKFGTEAIQNLQKEEINQRAKKFVDMVGLKFEKLG